MLMLMLMLMLIFSIKLLSTESALHQPSSPSAMVAIVAIFFDGDLDRNPTTPVAKVCFLSCLLLLTFLSHNCQKQPHNSKPYHGDYYELPVGYQHSLVYPSHGLGSLGLVASQRDERGGDTKKAQVAVMFV
jgi:hypothetical protein